MGVVGSCGTVSSGGVNFFWGCYTRYIVGAWVGLEDDVHDSV